MIRKLTLLLALLLLLIVGGSLAVLRWPGLLLNDRSLELARRYLGKHGIADIEWAKATLEVTSESLFRKRLRLVLEDVCYQRPEVVRACFASLRAEAKIDLSHFPPGLTEVGPVTADGGRFRLLSARLSGTVALDGRAVPRLEELKLSVHAKAALAEGAVRVQAKVEGQASLRELRARLAGSARGVLPGGGKLSVDGCELVAARAGRGGTLRVDCPVEGEVPRLAELKGLGVPERAAARLTAELKTESFPPDPSERTSGRVEARLEPVRTPVYELAGGAAFEVDAIPLELPEKGKLQARAGLKLSVARFERLARRLEGGPWAVWAPLRNLTGSVELAASGDIDLTGGRVPLRFATRLRSPSQKLDLDATGALEIAGLRGHSRFRSELDVVLSDVQLELPRLDLAAPPRLLPDSRVAQAPSAQQRAGVAAESPSMDFSIRIHTPADHPARVLSNLAQAPVPVTLDLALGSASPFSGTIAVRSFPVKFFNRGATIDHFRLDLKEPQSESPIDGTVKIDLTDYQFHVLATGTAGKPRFSFESDPPLSQNQILSVLIYGRAPDELDSDESATVGNTEAAVRDQAIGLASFFILGSTPVQGLAYDPKTKALQIKFRVAEGTSLNVGTATGDLRDIGIRRRLGKNWSITTDLTKGTGDTNVLSAFLEWAHRY